MPLRLDIKRKLSARSDRVKSVDLHPTEPWMLASLYNGNVHVWNHETQQLVKSFEVCELPVRATRFVARKHWVVTGSDDMQIRVFNYNTLERAHHFEAHADYIRSIAVHPSQPFVLSSSDDMSIKLWNWDKKWACTQVFEGHTHYVMQVVFNPKDNNTFASASLDRTLKVWQLGSAHPNFTLEGHEKGVNCLDYYMGGDKPYLISGADDRLVKIWDYQNKTCVQTLDGHAQNISSVAFHPELPIILTGSEDGTFRVWHANTYRLESTLNYGLERGWAIAVTKGSNNVALGYDEGSVMIQLGREEPAMSMDTNGKIIWAKHSEIQQANIKSLGADAEIKDGEKLPLDFKDMGSCEIYPQSLRHSPNGRFVVVCGDGEYIIYTAMALRNKCFGPAQEFVWSHDSSEYAIRESSSQIKIYKNFKERTSFKPDFGAEAILGGNMLGVRSPTGLAFYDWETTKLVRRIEITPKSIDWNESGELVCIATEESFFILKFKPDAVANATPNQVTEDGIEDAFDVVGEIQETVKTGLWVGDCYIYTSAVNRLNYYVGGEIVTISHLDRVHYLLGYIPKDNRIYLGDKELNVVSYSLLLSVMEYQTVVMRRDFESADKILPTIPKEHRGRVAHFLEKQGFRAQALAVTTDSEHKFELALQLGELQTAHQLAVEAESEDKWKQLAELATKKAHFGLAQECLHQAQDFGGLLLLASASGNAPMVQKLGDSASEAGQNNIAFLSYFVLGKLEECLEVLISTNRLPEATFFARTYLPSQVSRVVGLWRDSLAKKNKKAAQALADPTEYENLFPGLRGHFQAEKYLKLERSSRIPATAYPTTTPNQSRNVAAEVAASLAAGTDLDHVAITESQAMDDEEEEEFSLAPASLLTPKEASPLTLKEASPLTPKEASPLTPKEASPLTPKEASPLTPKEASPLTPKEASPLTPKEASPLTPKEASPLTPKEASPFYESIPSPAVPVLEIPTTEASPSVEDFQEPAIVVEEDAVMEDQASSLDAPEVHESRPLLPVSTLEAAIGLEAVEQAFESSLVSKSPLTVTEDVNAVDVPLVADQIVPANEDVVSSIPDQPSLVNEDAGSVDVPMITDQLILGIGDVGVVDVPLIADPLILVNEDVSAVDVPSIADMPTIADQLIPENEVSTVDVLIIADQLIPVNEDVVAVDVPSIVDLQIPVNEDVGTVDVPIIADQLIPVNEDVVAADVPSIVDLQIPVNEDVSFVDAPLIMDPLFLGNDVGTAAEMAKPLRDPFESLFDSAINTLVTAPEAGLDLLDPFATVPSTSKHFDHSINVASLLDDFDSPVGPIETKEFSSSLEAISVPLPSEPLSVPNINTFEAFKDPSPVPASLFVSSASASPAPESSHIPEPVADDDFKDDWGDDEWGDDGELDLTPAAVAPVNLLGLEEDDELVGQHDLPGQQQKQQTTAKTTLDEEAAKLEAELELDLENMDLNDPNIDTSDLNLSDDFLSD